MQRRSCALARALLAPLLFAGSCAGLAHGARAGSAADRPASLAAGAGDDARAGAPDPRAAYDVRAYRLDLAVDPQAQRIAGTLALEARVLEDGLSLVRLDLHGAWTVSNARLVDAELANDSALDGAPLRAVFADEHVDLALPAPLAAGALVRVALDYAGEPRAQDAFTGFHWRTTPDGRPWIATSCQSIGAHTWWPCKASFFHPEDKPERVLLNYDVPAGLTAVGNGRLLGREERDGRTLFRWRHDYPLPTYSVTLDVAPYVEVASEVELPGIAAPVPWVYWVLPEHVERAALQFADVPRLLWAYGEAFGPFPYPESKFALVEVPFWGMEHSTAIAYGSSFPAWIAQHGGKDPFASRNASFDYILVHESAHEWWGNAVSAADWRDFWLHEGFATYAETVWLEATQGREAATRWLEGMRKRVGKKARLVFPRAVENANQAYNGALYDKGALVLDTLRHYLADDRAWWRGLRAFQAEFRYRNATTEDFRRTLERESGQDLARFFDEWVRGEGWPELRGTVHALGERIQLEVEVGASASTSFRVPLDLAWQVGELEHRERVWLEPGANRLELEAGGPPAALRVVELEHLFGRHELTVR